MKILESYSGSEMINGQLNAIQRGLGYQMPSDYDDWGWHRETGKSWDYSFCIMDDFGNAVPYDPWPYQFEDCCAVLEAVGNQYKLVYPIYH